MNINFAQTCTCNNNHLIWNDSPMIFTHDCVARGNHWGFASPVTEKSFFAVPINVFAADVLVRGCVCFPVSETYLVHTSFVLARSIFSKIITLDTIQLVYKAMVCVRSSVLEVTYNIGPEKNGRCFADELFEYIFLKTKFVFCLKHRWSLFPRQHKFR